MKLVNEKEWSVRTKKENLKEFKELLQKYDEDKIIITKEYNCNLELLYKISFNCEKSCESEINEKLIKIIG